MPTPSIRTTRGIRARIAKRKGMRTVRRMTIDRKGLVLDGERFPYWVGADVGIRHMGNRSIVSMDVLTERVEIQGPLHRGVTITESWD